MFVQDLAGSGPVTFQFGLSSTLGATANRATSGTYVIYATGGAPSYHQGTFDFRKTAAQSVQNGSTPGYAHWTIGVFAGEGEGMECGWNTTSKVAWFQSNNFNSQVYADIALNPSGGKVAIGKLVPTAPLDVVGEIKTTVGVSNSGAVEIKSTGSYVALTSQNGNTIYADNGCLIRLTNGAGSIGLPSYRWGEGYFVDVNASGKLLLATSTPGSSSATGTTGTIAWDTNYIYVCIATNTWKRAAIASW